MDLDEPEDRKPDIDGQPKPIIKLDESVVNRIAAGEIIQRPSAALKELIENCLDAGAKSIKILVKDGGMKLLQIQDDGCGIRHADLPILCQRFTTSKLRQFEDLMAMTTYGFRGEALASVSHVAHLSVLTKTKEATCAWKCSYSDGVLVPPRPGASAEPTATAGNQGTTIIAEDLFYNVPTRKKALKSVSEEYSRVCDVVQRYAVHNPSVAFVCKKVGQAAPSVSTPSLSSAQQTIKATYGPTISKELIHLPLYEDEELGFKVEGWITGANYNANKKREGFLFFINNRLVDAPKIKKAVEALYLAILPKGAYPWIYLSLQIDPANIDVNVHPTKKEVRFLNEDEITESICIAMQEALTGSNSSRTFSMQSSAVQTLLPGASDPSASRPNQSNKMQDDGDEEEEESDEEQTPRSKGGRESSAEQEIQIDMKSMSRHRTSSSSNAKAGPSKPAPKHKIRVDPTVRTLDSMFPPVNPSQPAPSRQRNSSSSSAPNSNDNLSTARKRPKPFTEEQGRAVEDAIDIDGLMEEGGLRSDGEDDYDDGVDWKDRGGGDDQEVEPTRKVGVGGGGLIKESVCTLSSVRKLREKVKKDAHKGMTKLFQNHTFIGLVDYDLSLSIVQHETKMFMVNHSAVAEELFYQLGLLQFGAFGRMHLQPPADIKFLVDIAIKYEKDVPEDQKEVKANAIVKRLIDRRDMLDEYFMMNISEDGKLFALPLLLPGYTPNTDRLPSLLMRLGPGVDWTDEVGCFDSFLRELASFYIPVPTLNNYDKSKESTEPESAERKHERFQVEHVIFPATRRHLLPPKSLDHGEVTQIANLPDLYKIFERC